MSKRSAKNLVKTQEQAIEMFREGRTNDAIASQLGVSVRSVQRWRNTPEDSRENFQKTLSTLAEVKVQNSEVTPLLKPHIDSLATLNNEDYNTISRLFAATLSAIEDLLCDSDLSPRDRVSCFKLVLELRRDIQSFCSTPHQVRDLSDFELVRRTLREAILSDPTSSGAIALLKLLQAQEHLPEHILPNERKAERQIMLSEISKMTAEEKVKLYRQYTSKSLNK